MNAPTLRELVLEAGRNAVNQDTYMPVYERVALAGARAAMEFTGQYDLHRLLGPSADPELCRVDQHFEKGL